MSCPLYIRSVYSLLSSMCTIEGIISYGKGYGYEALGLVDRNVLAGAMSFKKACEKASIKPVFGLEFDLRLEERVYTMVLYAKDDEGFKNMMGLSSYINTRDEKIIDLKTLDSYRDHCFLCLLSDNMPLTYAIDRGLDAKEMLEKQTFWFRDYIVGLVDHDIAVNARRDQIMKPLLKEKGIKMIAMSRTFYLNRDDHEEFNVLKCIWDKQILDDSNSVEESGRHFMSKEEYDSLYEREEPGELDRRGGAGDRSLCQDSGDDICRGERAFDRVLRA